MILTRRTFNTALSMTALLAAAGVTPFGLIGHAQAQEVSLTDLATAHPLGDVVLGPADASVTIIEYASMSCGHCAEFQKTVYPKLKAEYIDTNKVRFIFREFPLDIKAAAGSMLARCIGKNDPNKYHAIIDTLFATQNEWVMQNTTEQLKRVGKQAGMSDQAFTECLSDQALLDGLKKGQDFAYEKLKVDSTPTFFVNGTRVKGAATFEELEKLIKPNLKG